MNKVYLVRYGRYWDQGISGVFSTKEKAEQYAEIHNKIDYWYGDFWIDECILDEHEYPKDTRVKKYYSVCISLSTDNWVKVGDLYNKAEDYEIFTEPVIIEKHEGYIFVKSTTSREHARKIAIEQYQIWSQQKLEEEIMENK